MDARQSGPQRYRLQFKSYAELIKVHMNRTQGFLADPSRFPFYYPKVHTRVPRSGHPLYPHEVSGLVIRELRRFDPDGPTWWPFARFPENFVGGVQAQRAAIMDLIDSVSGRSASVNNPSRLLTEKVHIVDLPAKLLGDMYYPEKGTIPTRVRETETTCDILQGCTIINPTCTRSDHGTIFITLLTGAILWIVWPRSVQNWESIERDFCANQNRSERLDAAKSLSGGKLIAQKPGKLLSFPPFYPFTGILIETSVLVKYTAVNTRSLESGCKWAKTTISCSETRLEAPNLQVKIAENILSDITTILKSPSTLDPLDIIPRNWDEIKSTVLEIMNVEQRQQLATSFHSLLQLTRRPNVCPFCRCYMPCRTALMDHFWDTHWMLESNDSPISYSTAEILRTRSGRSWSDSLTG